MLHGHLVVLLKTFFVPAVQRTCASGVNTNTVASCTANWANKLTVINRARKTAGSNSDDTFLNMHISVVHNIIPADMFYSGYITWLKSLTEHCLGTPSPFISHTIIIMFDRYDKITVGLKNPPTAVSLICSVHIKLISVWLPVGGQRVVILWRSVVLDVEGGKKRFK